MLSWLVAAAAYATLPPSPDQFNHAYLGWRWVMGDVPYRHTIDPNWPGVMQLHALAVWIFGVNLWSWRTFDLLLFAASSAFLCDLVRRSAGSTGAWACAVLCPLVYVAAGSWIAGQHDMSAAQFLVVALWFHVRAYERGQPAWQFGAGAMLAWAMLNKPTVGVMLPLLALHALLLRVPVKRAAVHSAAVVVGMGVTLAASAWLVTLRGTTWTELWEATVVYNVTNQYVGDLTMKPISLGEVVKALLVQHGQRWLDLVLASLPGLVWLVRRPDRSLADTALPVLWLTGVLSYLAQARGWGYQLAPALVALIGLAAASLATLARWRAAAPRSRWPVVFLTGLVLLLAARQGDRWADQYGGLPRALADADLTSHRARYRENDGITVAEAVEFARRLQQAPPPRCVLVVGKGSAINFLSRRRQPTRFYYFPMLMRALPPMPLADAWQQAWRSELEVARCHFVLVDKAIHDAWLPTKSPASDALRTFLDAYALVGTVGSDDGLRLYQRR